MATVSSGVMAGPSVRPEDLPLHEDVRWLAASLGKVILRLEGQSAFDSVESLRRACRARRHAEPDAPTLGELLEQVSALPLERAATVARAFTLFFLLINTAEQVHRVRRARAYRSAESDEPQPGGARWAMRVLRSEGARRRGRGARHAIASTCGPSLPRIPRNRRDGRCSDFRRASPTCCSSARRVSRRQACDRGPARRRGGAALADRRGASRSAHRDGRGQHGHLVSRDASPGRERARARNVRAGIRGGVRFRRAIDLRHAMPLTIGNWGGDRDGNLFVTPEVTPATARRASFSIGRYARSLWRAGGASLLSAALAEPSSRSARLDRA